MGMSREDVAGACDEMHSSHFLPELKRGMLLNYKGSLPL